MKTETAGLRVGRTENTTHNNLIEFVEIGKDPQSLSLEQIVKILTEQKENI